VAVADASSTDKTQTAEGLSLAGAGLALANDPGFLATLSPEARQLLEDQAKDYAQYIADGPIYHQGVLAYPDGAPVPASNVKRWQYDQLGMVAKVGTRAAERVIERSTVISPSTIKAPGDD
jgi:hypothetical protein